MKKEAYQLAVVPGDGTGPEVILEGLKVLQAVARKYDFSLNCHQVDRGGMTNQYFDLLQVSAITQSEGAGGYAETGNSTATIAVMPGGKSMMIVDDIVNSDGGAVQGSRR